MIDDLSNASKKAVTTMKRLSTKSDQFHFYQMDLKDKSQVETVFQSIVWMV